MKVGSLFAGIGGMDLGLERAGMEVAWQVEIDPFCRKVLAKHWPDVKRYEDVRDVGSHNLEPVDLICGGFPCQPVSQIGLRKGQDDERWLWPEFGRVVREMVPRYVLVENTTGLLDRGMGDVLGTLASLGYDAEWDCLPAGAFGARHQRYRTFLVAHSAGIGLEERHGPGSKAAQHTPLLDASPLLESIVRWNLNQPAICRATDGIPSRVDRIKGCGNAVVPQVAEWIGNRIMEAR